MLKESKTDASTMFIDFFAEIARFLLKISFMKIKFEGIILQH
jgi:hypothetical protein